jgi:hypothetical protein
VDDAQDEKASAADVGDRAEAAARFGEREVLDRLAEERADHGTATVPMPPATGLTANRTDWVLENTTLGLKNPVVNWIAMTSAVSPAIPKKAALPSENCPPKPPVTFHAAAAVPTESRAYAAYRNDNPLVPSATAQNAVKNYTTRLPIFYLYFFTVEHTS